MQHTLMAGILALAAASGGALPDNPPPPTSAAGPTEFFTMGGPTAYDLMDLRRLVDSVQVSPDDFRQASSIADPTRRLEVVRNLIDKAESVETSIANSRSAATQLQIAASTHELPEHVVATIGTTRASLTAYGLTVDLTDTPKVARLVGTLGQFEAAAWDTNPGTGTAAPGPYFLSAAPDAAGAENKVPTGFVNWAAGAENEVPIGFFNWAHEATELENKVDRIRISYDAFEPAAEIADPTERSKAMGELADSVEGIQRDLAIMRTAASHIDAASATAVVPTEYRASLTLGTQLVDECGLNIKLTAPAQIAQLKTIAQDFWTKLSSLLKRKSEDAFDLVKVHVHTRKTGAEVPHCKVYYVCLGYEEKPKYASLFDKESSPTTQSIPAGTYCFWTDLGGKISNHEKHDIGANGETDQTIDVVAPSS